MAVENIFTNFIFAKLILPWILVFTLVFAILEKTNILGEGKRKINAIVSAVIGLLLLGFPASRDVIVNLIPFLVITAVVIFIFLLLYGFVSGEKKGDPLGKGVKIGIGVVVGLGLIIALMVAVGAWESTLDFFTESSIGANMIFIIVAAAAVVAVLWGGKGGKDKE